MSSESNCHFVLADCCLTAFSAHVHFTGHVLWIFIEKDAQVWCCLCHDSFSSSRETCSSCRLRVLHYVFDPNAQRTWPVLWICVTVQRIYRSRTVCLKTLGSSYRETCSFCRLHVRITSSSVRYLRRSCDRLAAWLLSFRLSLYFSSFSSVALVCLTSGLETCCRKAVAKIGSVSRHR